MITKHFLSGTGVAIVTPFLENGEIDTAALEVLVNHLIVGGVDYLVVLGTTGETATVSKEEKNKLLQLVNNYTNNRVKLVAGIGGNDTREVIASMKELSLSGYCAILSVSPYYNKPNSEGLFQHYKAIAEAAPLPVIMYNVPGRTGMNVSTATTLRIARECNNIIATKEASGNMEQIMQIIAEKPQGFEVISGDDGLALPLIACGAIGVISVVANAYPKQYSDMIDLCLEGKFNEAREAHEKILPIINTLFLEGSPSGVKAYLSLMGIVKETFRLPVVGVGADSKMKITELLNSI
jgi:4-hydroxy-tetrahydrodipicolinate synthase